jgi:hypothetical protein
MKSSFAVQLKELARCLAPLADRPPGRAGRASTQTIGALIFRLMHAAEKRCVEGACGTVRKKSYAIRLFCIAQVFAVCIK